MRCYKKAWFDLRNGWVWCGAIPQAFLIILASLLDLKQQHKWACWSGKFSCSMLIPDWIVLTDIALSPINMAALICCPQATLLLLIWWVAVLKHVVGRLRQLRANKIVQLAWLNMPRSHTQTCSSTARTSLPANMHHKVPNEHWLPCHQNKTCDLQWQQDMMLLSGSIFLPWLMSIRTLLKGDTSNAGRRNLKTYMKMSILH